MRLQCLPGPRLAVNHGTALTSGKKNARNGPDLRYVLFSEHNSIVILTITSGVSNLKEKIKL